MNYVCSKTVGYRRLRLSPRHGIKQEINEQEQRRNTSEHMKLRKKVSGVREGSRVTCTSRAGALITAHSSSFCRRLQISVKLSRCKAEPRYHTVLLLTVQVARRRCTVLWLSRRLRQSPTPLASPPTSSAVCWHVRPPKTPTSPQLRQPPTLRIILSTVVTLLRCGRLAPRPAADCRVRRILSNIMSVTEFVYTGSVLLSRTILRDRLHEMLSLSNSICQTDLSFFSFAYRHFGVP